MKKFEYYTPTRIVFGKDSEKETGRLIKMYGGTRLLIVYGGKSAVESGLLKRIEDEVKAEGIEYISMGGVVPNPVLSRTRQIIKEGLEFKCDFVLGVGGGSVLDTAKAVALGLYNPEADIWDYFAGIKKPVKSLPHAGVITISAAGSETSDSAVITNDETKPYSKRGINGDFNRCRFAVMNPELTYTLPKYQISAGVADIFMHTSERYFAAILGNHMTDEIAEGLLRNIIKYGRIGVDNPSDYEAMSEIMWSGSLSHIGITGLGSRGDLPKDGDWACHQIGMALSAIYDYTHGATLTAIWGSWARYVCKKNLGRFAQLARNVYGIEEASDEKACEIAIKKSEEFFKSIGMPISLTELMGRTPSDEELTALSENCSFGKKRTIGAFMVLSYDDMYNIYKAAV